MTKLRERASFKKTFDQISKASDEYSKKVLVLLAIILATLLPPMLNQALIIFVHQSPQRAVTAVPALGRPPTDQCVVSLLRNVTFSPTVNQPFLGRYEPPVDCHPPWNKVVLDWEGTVPLDQFDHIAALWLGRVEIFRSSTPEVGGLEWHVEKDVTQYAPVFVVPSNLTAIVGTPSGRIIITATLTFYKVDPLYPEGLHPDAVVPVSSTGDLPWFRLDESSPSSNVELTLPTNIVSAYLEIYATGHGCDESWYSNSFVTNSGCKGADFQESYREIQVYIDSQLAGIALPFPILYTGALDPTLWETIPAVNALNIPPYKVNLTPFAGILADSAPHSIVLEIVNNHNYWLVDGNLLLGLETGLGPVSGNITLLSVPLEATQETTRLPGLVSTRASRSYVISGYVDSPEGRITTVVQQTILFLNRFYLNLVSVSKSLTSGAMVTTVVATTDSNGTRVQTSVDRYLVSFRRWFAVDWIPLTVYQEVAHKITLSMNGSIETESLVQHSISAELGGDTTGRYASRNLAGFCYDHSITSHRGRIVNDGQDGICRDLIVSV